MATNHEYDYCGHFCCTQEELLNKLKNAKAYVFDWDGVFNDGSKTSQRGSGFNETDSMGTNLLRFSHYLEHGTAPLTAIISGEKNESAGFFANRECFHYSFYKIAHKTDALDVICKENNIQPDEVVYFFDDVLDLSIAKVCGVRILLRKQASVFFSRYCVQNKLADYVSAYEGGYHGLRECCEMLMTLRGNFSRVLELRTDFSPEYQKYLEIRKSVSPKIFTRNENSEIIPG